MPSNGNCWLFPSKFIAILIPLAIPLFLTFFVGKANSFQLTLQIELYMGARRYGTYLQVEHEKRNSISTNNHVLFVYHIDTIALHWQEKPTSLTNENKWIDNPHITIVECVGAKSQMKNALNNDYKINNGRNFQFKILIHWLVLGDKICEWQIVHFSNSFSAARIAITKGTEYVTFGFSLRRLIFFL